jgi:hypothetical protein
METGTISRKSALATIQRYDGEGGDAPPFSIRFVKMGPEGKGEVREYARCRRGGKDIEMGVSHGTKPKEFYRLRERNLVLIHNLDLGQDRSINVHLIPQFNGLRVKH